jgi:hypothetical protein
MDVGFLRLPLHITTPLKFQMSHLPRGIALTEEIAKYMMRKFKSLQIIPAPHVQHPDDWPLQLIIDCDLAVNVIAAAYKNQGKSFVYVEFYSNKMH